MTYTLLALLACMHSVCKQDNERCGPTQRKLPVVQEPNVHELDNSFSQL
jgi:hypothetical protein